MAIKPAKYPRRIGSWVIDEAEPSDWECGARYVWSRLDEHRKFVTMGCVCCSPWTRFVRAGVDLKERGGTP